jgi:hypothetical protein
VIEFGEPSSTIRAGALVGTVLLEAIVLYVGFGALERVAKPVIARLTHA